MSRQDKWLSVDVARLVLHSDWQRGEEARTDLYIIPLVGYLSKYEHWLGSQSILDKDNAHRFNNWKGPRKKWPRWKNVHQNHPF